MIIGRTSQKSKIKNRRRRRSYYGFSRDYPNGSLSKNSYRLTLSKTLRNREIIGKVLITLGFICVFILGFFLSSLALDLSNKPIN